MVQTTHHSLAMDQYLAAVQSLAVAVETGNLVEIQIGCLAVGSQRRHLPNVPRTIQVAVAVVKKHKLAETEPHTILALLKIDQSHSSVKIVPHKIPAVSVAEDWADSWRTPGPIEQHTIPTTESAAVVAAVVHAYPALQSE